MTLFELAAVLTLNKSAFDKGISEAEGQAKGFGSKLKDGLAGGIKATASVLTASTGAVVSFGKEAVEAGMTFDTSMSQVAAISGAAGTELEQLRDKAREMGASTVFSASEAADAMNYMAMAGWKTEDMLGGIEGIMNLAAASGGNLASTSDIVTNALTAFGMKVEESGKFADILAVASSNANTDVSMMGETFKYVAPIAGTLGFNAEDTAVAIGLMANSGIQASQAGTSLRGALTRLVKPTEEMQGAMVRLGLATVETEHIFDQAKIDKLQSKVADKTATAEKAQISYNNAVSKYGANSAQAQKAAISLETAQRKLAEATAELTKEQAGYDEETGIQNNLLTNSEGEMKSLNEIVVQLRSTFADLTEAEKAEAAATLFGQEAASGMLAIINASEEDFGKLTEAVNNADGAAQQMAETMTDNLAGDISKFNSALGDARIELNDQLTPSLRSFVQFATDGIGDITKAFSEGGMEEGFAQIGTTFGEGITMIAEKAPQAVEAGALLLQNLVEGITSEDSIATISQSAVDIMETFVTMIFDNLPMLAQSAFDIISTLAFDLSEQLPTLIPAAMQAIVELAMTLTDPENLTKLVDSAITLVMSIADGLIEAIPVLIEALPTIIENLIQAFATNAPKLMAVGPTLMIQLGGALIKAIPQLLSHLPEVIKAVVDGFGTYAGEFLKIGENIISGVWDGIKGMGDWIGEQVGNFFGGIVDGVKGLLGIKSPSRVFAGIGENMALGVGEGFGDEFADIRRDINDQMDFTATADVQVNKKSGYDGYYEYGNGGARGYSSAAAPAERQPLTIIVQLQSGVEVARAILEDINDARRLDGLPAL